MALAWASIVEDVTEGRLNIDQIQRKQAEKESQAANAVVPRAARECFKWLLCPVQDDPTAPKPTVESFSLNTTSGNAPDEVERVCRQNALVIDTWSPIHLRDELRKLYWKGGKVAVGAMAFWEDTLRYLYLPRLKNRHSLSQAIRTGAASRDFFGTASARAGRPLRAFASEMATSSSTIRSSLSSPRRPRSTRRASRNPMSGAGPVRATGPEARPLAERLALAPAGRPGRRREPAQELPAEPPG